MNKQLAESLTALIGNQRDFDLLLKYLEHEEKLILQTNLTADEDKELRRNQGKLQLIHKMKGLRETIRMELGK